LGVSEFILLTQKIADDTFSTQWRNPIAI
jgi:hypothetical protein